MPRIEIVKRPDGLNNVSLNQQRSGKTRRSTTENVVLSRKELDDGSIEELLLIEKR